MSRDPARLTDGDPSELGELVSSARSDVLSPDAIARLHARLLPLVGSPPDLTHAPDAPDQGPPDAPAPPTAPAAPAPTAPAPTAPAPIAPPGPPGPVAPVAPVVPVPPAALAATAGKSLLATIAPWAVVGGAGAALAIAVTVPKTTVPPQVSVMSSSVASASAASASVASAVASARAAVSAGPVASSERPAADPAPAAVSAALAARLPVRTARPAATGADGDPAEGVLLLEARRVLDTDPRRALALTEQQARQFPASQLRAERARIAAEARRRIGP